MTGRCEERHALPPPHLRAAAARAFVHQPATVSFTTIGTIHSAWTWREEAPRQGQVLDSGAVIALRPGLQNLLKDLDGFSPLWVIAWFHRSNGWNHQVVPPRDRVKRGLFATRSPDRPAAIGLTCVELVGILGTRLWIRGHDLLDGTPVLDLKPYIPAYDAFPEAKAGWVDALGAPGPDHRQSPGEAARRRERRQARPLVAGQPREPTKNGPR